ncbi:Unknown protein sequence, partial [Pseudomonas syringae pv. spinaceae]
VGLVSNFLGAVQNGSSPRRSLRSGNHLQQERSMSFEDATEIQTTDDDDLLNQLLKVGVGTASRHPGPHATDVHAGAPG